MIFEGQEQYSAYGGVMWQSPDGQTQLLRHCEGIIELVHADVSVMPPTSFERATDYLWQEFPPFETQNADDPSS